MGKYYINNRNGNLITTKEIIRDNLSSASYDYYEYRTSGMEGVYIETWYCGSGKYLDYAYDIEIIRNSGIPYFIQKQLYFEQHGAKPVELYAYAVPPSKYNSDIEQYEKYMKGGEG